MISFGSQNLIQEVFKNDNIDIDLHLTNDKLDHIFREYLFLIDSNKLGNDEGWVILNYGLRSDKFDDLYNDSTLGSVLTYQLSYYYILNILNSVNIKLVTNVNSPNFINIYFNQELTTTSYGNLCKYTTGVEYFNDHIFSISKLIREDILIIDDERDQMYSNRINRSFMNIDNSLVIVNENFITQDDIKISLDHLIKSVNKNGEFVETYEHNLKKVLRFAFKLKIYDIDYLILFDTNYNNYIIGSRLKAAFMLMDTKINNVIQKQKEVSYISKGDINFIDGWSSNIEFIEGNILIPNSYLKNYIKTKYGSGSTKFDLLISFDIAKRDIKDDIIKYVDEIGKGVAYLDFDSNMVHESIGDQEDYSFLGIYGYDEIRKRPIILAVNKDYETAGSQFRSIKLISGGITAINNEELDNDITSSDYNYLLQTTLADVQDIHYMDMIKMVSSVYGIPAHYPKQFTLFNGIDSTKKFFYNNEDYDARGSLIDAWVYKQVKPYDSTGDVSLPVYSMNCFVMDTTSNYGNSNFRVRSIEFLLKGNIVPIDTDQYTQPTITNQTYLSNVINQQYKINAANSSQYQNSSAQPTRTVIHFDRPILFDQIRVTNYHYYSGQREYGIKGVGFYIANFHFESYDFNTATHLLTPIFKGNLRMHQYDDLEEELSLLPLPLSNIPDQTIFPQYALLDIGSFGLDETASNSYAIPQDTMIDLFTNVTSELSLLTFLYRWFQTEGDSNIIDFDNVAYNNLFIKYIPILNGNTMYHISHQNSVVGFRTINELLLKSVAFDVKHELLLELYKTGTTNYKFLKGNEVVLQINDDSEFNSNIDQAKEIFTTDTTVKEITGIDVSTQSEFLTMLMNENIYKSTINNYSGSYVCGLFRLEDIVKTSYNGSVVFNKVIGTDQFSYYSLKSVGNDITFSGYFINSYTDNHYAQQLLDLDNGKVKSLSIVPFEFNCGKTNPIITNMEVISNRELYVIDKSYFDIMQNNYLNIFKIYNILPIYQIEYSMKPLDIELNQIFNVYSNEVIVVTEV